MYAIQVWARNVGSSTPYDAWTTLMSQLVIPAFVAATPELPAISCAEEPYQYFVSGVPVAFSNTWVNARSSPIRLYSITSAGLRQLFSTLAPGAYVGLAAPPTSPFVVTNTSDQCLGVYLPQRQLTHVIVR